jgi:hypothetical protein
MTQAEKLTPPLAHPGSRRAAPTRILQNRAKTTVGIVSF